MQPPRAQGYQVNWVGPSCGRLQRHRMAASNHFFLILASSTVAMPTQGSCILGPELLVLHAQITCTTATSAALIAISLPLCTIARNYRAQPTRIAGTHAEGPSLLCTIARNCRATPTCASRTHGEWPSGPPGANGRRWLGGAPAPQAPAPQAGGASPGAHACS